MKSFGKSIRNCVPAIGLGLASAFGMVAVTSVAAAPAYAQTASKEFVEPYQAATAALAAGNYSEAVSQAGKALPHAADNQQKQAIEGIRIQSYYQTKNWKPLITSLENSMAMGGLTAAQVKSFKQLQMSAYSESGNAARALELTKAYVNQYGGTSQQFAFLASSSLNAKDHANAVSFGQKAISQARKEGKRPKERWYQIIMKSHYDTGAMDKYYDTMGDLALVHSKDDYWRALIQRARKAEQYSRKEMTHDYLRAMSAAGVALTPSERLQMAEQANFRGMSIEAEKVMKPLIDSGDLDTIEGLDVARYKSLYASIAKQASDDRAKGLAAGEAEAAKSSTGALMVSYGEAYMGDENYSKALELMEAGLAKGGMSPDEIAHAKLHIGIAQFKSGNKSAARTTWGEVSDKRGAQALAENWILISKK